MAVRLAVSSCGIAGQVALRCDVSGTRCFEGRSCLHLDVASSTECRNYVVSKRRQTLAPQHSIASQTRGSSVAVCSCLDVEPNSAVTLQCGRTNAVTILTFRKETNRTAVVRSA